MALQENRIAMVSPLLNVYSETFIQQQKNRLKGSVFYYYGGNLPTHLENHGKLLSRTLSLKNKIYRKLGFTTFNKNEIAFIKSLKKHKIQVVLAQYGMTAHQIIKICEHLKIPLVTHFHGYDASVLSIIEKHNNYKDVFRYSSSVIAVSKVMKHRFLVLGCPEDKIVYNTYGPDPSFLDIHPNFSKKTFIALGRFVDKKAPYYTILAFSKVLKKHPDAKLVLGGGGVLLEVCENIVKSLKIENSVSFPGVISREQFIEILSTSLAFVQHSITANSGDQEGTPVSIIEASAAGVPVVSTYHAGIPDVIEHDKTGLLCKEHDIETMSLNMMKILDDVHYAKQLGNAGKERIKELFTIERHIQVLDDVIDNAIHKNT
ncbi:glycosyltransferase [Algibacter sp. 2305UL17-15]|uniref:glycosyltransferase n=1 Tax=Algibacter sp. 2305UL17-15 TaxID=3231268 RepID=UPI00345A60D7